LTKYFKPFDLFNIAGQPHDMPASLDKLSFFYVDTDILPKEHWDAFIDHITTFKVCHINVLYKCFSLSLNILCTLQMFFFFFNIMEIQYGIYAQ
jgi:hypothetical protein